MDDDSLLREVAAAPAVALPTDIATWIMLEPGVVVDDVFRIEARLGAGGMGVVYAARDLKLDREIALKLMRLDRGVGGLGSKLPEAFEREARATARLNHPNIVTLHQFGKWKGVLYLVLERLHGETLATRLERGPMPLRDGLAIIEQVARALVHTHAAGITHRDLKPSNVFVLHDDTVKVLDFGVSGLSRAQGEPATAPADEGRSTMSLAGTPGYMAPEQWQGEHQDARTDVFAVGVMLHQIVTGRLPFGTGKLDQAAAAPSIERVPADAIGLAPLIARCLAPRREDRLTSAGEIASELAAIASRLERRTDRGVVSTTRSLATARIKPRERRRRIAVAAAAALTAVAIGTAVIRSSGSATPAGCDGESDGVEDAAAAIWNPASRAQLAAAFRDPLGAVTWPEIARALDRYAAELDSLQRSTCRERSPLVTACLDARRAAFRDVIARLPTTDPETALDATTVLPAVSDCVDPGVLAGRDTIGPTQAPLRDPAGAVPMAISFGSAYDDMLHAGAFVDGDLVVTGHAGPGARLLGELLAVPDSLRGSPRTGILARLDGNGRLVWHRAQRASRAIAIASARPGQLVVGGFARPDNDLGATLSPDNADIDCFVASLDAATGAPRWVRTCGATRFGTARGVAADGAGNVYAAGDFGGRARFSGDVDHDARATPTSAPFAASWTADGTLRWVTAGSGTAASRTWSIAVTDDAAIVAATVTGTGAFGDRALRTGGCVIARLDRDTGAVRWLVEDAGEAGQCQVYGVAIRGDRIAAIGRRALKAGGGWVGELDLATGATVWRRAIGTGDQATPRSLAYAPDGTITVTGVFAARTLVVDDVVLLGHSVFEAFVLDFAPGGHCAGGLGFGGTGSDVSRWIGYDATGRRFVAGRFEAAIKAGNHTLRSAGGTDGFLLELKR